ncbi:PTS sugar transporter subunit IIA [Candidatus Cetobacterium colombiensis]|uniref:PTS sugar transporter subunit IIA n=1 Tax=Candidatus Cetobacterium colombiensis TaxID=3073100 RepID=A0ABU4W6X5_9FUSO|nr:PTS sugar transporter subunit IIA [Candidatus Cetobacterium colombiensis]MDX8335282.1 PTS sugar transporter subunit IIA [Candidatus Cetobacterium colombiensis]
MLNYFNIKMINILENTSISKDKVLKLMVSNMYKHSNSVIDEEVFYKEVLEREKIGTTGIGMGVAIPHARTEAIKDIVVSVGLLKEAVDFNSLDEEKVKIIILVGAPKNESKKYLELLSLLSKTFRNKKIRESILESRTTECLIEAVAEIG